MPLGWWGALRFPAPRNLIILRADAAHLSRFSPETMPLYFAYGANMDVAAMAGRCPKSRPLGRARLARHRFIVMEGGYASVMRDPRTNVHGVLWDLALADVPALDRFEEVARGLYRKAVQPVLRESAGPASALVYIGCATREGAPRPGYLEGVVAASQEWSLPAPYISYLESLISVRSQGLRL
jgi:gamma-glutamylcyclotransferase (GGCT)/AIG2-like uncharacterized protein YtfP